MRLMLRLTGGSLVKSSKIDTLRVAELLSGQDIVSLATSLGRSNARTDEQSEQFLKSQKISLSIWRDSNPLAYTIGWSEKHKSLKMQKYRAGSEPRHSTDFRTIFGIRIG